MVKPLGTGSEIIPGRRTRFFGNRLKSMQYWMHSELIPPIFEGRISQMLTRSLVWLTKDLGWLTTSDKWQECELPTMCMWKWIQRRQFDLNARFGNKSKKNGFDVIRVGVAHAHPSLTGDPRVEWGIRCYSGYARWALGKWF
jgi:hypothetical protein